MEYRLGKEGLATSLQRLLSQNEAGQRTSLCALQQQIDGMGAPYQLQADACLQQQAVAPPVKHPMPHRTQQQKLKDAQRALQAALVSWHACYQEVQLGQTMVQGNVPVNCQMVDHCSKLLSQRPHLEATAPATLSPPSGLGPPNANEVAHPWYVPVTGQFFGETKAAQRELPKTSPTQFADKSIKMPEEVGAAAGEETDTLRTHLQALLKFDASCILIVRKINRLGFDSAQVLEEHFSLRGTVVEVYVAHSRVKPIQGSYREGHGTRLRPSGLGFVVMSCAQEAAAILMHGVEQDICGCAIRVQKFQRRAAAESLDKVEEKQQAMPGEDELACRLVGA